MVKIILNAVFLYVLSLLFSGIIIDGWVAALVAGLVVCVVNAVVKPILQVISIPITIMTLGFFYLVVNALMLMLVSAIVPGFTVTGFWTAFFAAIVFSILNTVFGVKKHSR